MFRSISFITVLFFYKTAFSTPILSQCEAYLYSLEVVAKESLYESTMGVLKEYQASFRQIQLEALKELRSRLRERSVDVGLPFVSAVPAISTTTLDHLSAWGESSEEADMERLREWISEDPYLKWLERNWIPVAQPDEVMYEDSALSILINEGERSLLNQDAFEITLWGYLTRHLKRTGPIKLRPELAILRIMRDHDPKLGSDEMDLIQLILGYEKQKYVLNKFVSEMENFQHGSSEEWDRFKDVTEMNGRLAELKFSLKEWFPDYDESLFYLKQSRNLHLKNKIMENAFFSEDLRASFEDYIVAAASKYSYDRDFLELKREYFMIKSILFATSIADDVEILNEELAVLVYGLKRFYMY